MNVKKRATTCSADKALLDVWLRELGQLSSRNFAIRRLASEDLILRLGIYKKLDKHRGCVNTVSFNTDGDFLVSGSDDRWIILWDWETGRVKLSFHSGHTNNVFQAKIMPFTGDRSIVTCAADGEVRLALILERGGVETKLLAKHRERAHKLAIEPGSPHIFYTCGEDGLVLHFDLRTGAATELFTCRPIDNKKNYVPVVNLNAIAIDPRNPNLFAVAGLDEYTRLYDIRRFKWDGSTDFGQPADYFCPANLIGDEQVGITGLAFSDQSELIVSYNDEFIYLFTQDMGLGPNPLSSSPLSAGSEASEMGSDHTSAASPSTTNIDDRIAPQVYKGHRNCVTVKGVSFFGPKCEYVVSGSDCGRIFIWKKKGGELIRVMEADKHVVNCIEPHPHSTVLASSGIESDIKIWIPNAADRAPLPTSIEQETVLIPDRIHWFAFGDDNDDYFYDISDDDDNDGGGGSDSSGGDGDTDCDEEEDSDDDIDDITDNDNDNDIDDNVDHSNDDGINEEANSLHGLDDDDDVDFGDDYYADNVDDDSGVDNGNNNLDNFVGGYDDS